VTDIAAAGSGTRGGDPKVGGRRIQILKSIFFDFAFGGNQPIFNIQRQPDPPNFAENKSNPRICEPRVLSSIDIVRSASEWMDGGSSRS
jgi:hypothetical protein